MKNLSGYRSLAFILSAIGLSLLTSGCQTLCGKGSATRGICGDQNQRIADAPERKKEEVRLAEQRARQEEERIAQRQADQRRQEQEEIAQRWAIEEKFGVKVCAHPDFFGTVFMSRTQIETDCAYGIGSAPLRVLQANRGGLLVVPTSNSMNPMGRAVWIKTSSSFADGDLVQHLFVKSDGLHSYTDTTGARRTINAFKVLSPKK